MAYIPKNDDEQQQSGMNVLAPQGQQQQMQPEAQNQPQNVSGGESATIGAGQAQQSSQGQSQAPKGQQKKAKSGMFTNIRKYIDQNKAGAQRMSGKLQQNVSQQNQNIQQAIGKQQSDFMSRVNQNRERMQSAQQFGQQAIEQAKSQESMPMLQQQQQDLQQRVGQFGNVADQTQNINQYTGQVSDQQAAYNQAQQAYNQAQQGFTQQAQNLGNMSGLYDQVYRQAEQTANILMPSYVDPNYSREAFNQGLLSGDARTLQYLQGVAEQDQQYLSQFGQGYIAQSPQEQEAYNQAKSRLDAYNQYKNTMSQRSQTEQAQQSQLSQLESYQEQLGRAQEQQRLFDNKTQLQNELSELETRIQNAPESLTEQDIERFNNLRTGIERFDDAILNLSQQKRQVGELQQMAESLGTSQGRRNLMRQEFGRQGGYTSGQAALDNLILTGDQNAMRELVANSQAQADQAQNQLQEAFRQGRITQDEMVRGTRQIQRDLQAGVEEAQTALLEGSKDYRNYMEAEKLLAESGDADYIRNLLSGNMTDQRARTPQEQARIYETINRLNELGYDPNRQFTSEEMGLRARARTGEGTFIKELQEKLASGQGLSQEDMSILGITGQERFNQDPTQLLRNLQIDPNQFSVQDVANLSDVARADALARLSGEAAGENRFVNEQLGIDQLDRQRIEARNLRNPAEEFTRTREELAPQDKAMVDDFVSKLQSGQVFSSPEEARQNIYQDLWNHENAATRFIAEPMQELVEKGTYNTPYGPVTLDSILAGDQTAANMLSAQNYWAWVGNAGRHDVSVSPDSIINAIKGAHAKTQALKATYGGGNQNALRGEAESAYVQQDTLGNRIRT